jgi:hypothetical protein
VSGSRKMAPGDYDRLYLLIRTVNNYDPRFVVPYILGGLMVGDSPSHVREALEILRRGRENHPRSLSARRPGSPAVPHTFPSWRRACSPKGGSRKRRWLSCRP